jgi:hypothetical protein
MALHDRIALQVGAIGIRTELNAGEAYADYAGGLRKRLLRQKSELLAKEELRPKGIPEGVCRKQFPHVPRVALPPSQFPHETSCKTDHKRPSVSGVLLGVIEGHCKACEFYLEAAPQATEPTGRRTFNATLCPVSATQYGCVATQDIMSRGGPSSLRACPTGLSDLGG